MTGAGVLVTPSATSALEAMMLYSVDRGDEVILPSWAFPSCANVIAMRGAVPVFVDVDADLNIDPVAVEDALTSKTVGVLMLHYAGVPGNVRRIWDMCQRKGLWLFEDAAQAIGNWELTGHWGCLSFHATKNVECDQGGALVFQEDLRSLAEKIVHCGTDKLKMYRGEQTDYRWLMMGGQHVMSEYAAQALQPQLEQVEEINARRKAIWNIYSMHCPDIRRAKQIGNGHFFWFFDPAKKYTLARARRCGVKISEHYEALHNTLLGRQIGRAGSPCGNSLEAYSQLLKLDTNVTEEEALLACEVLWHLSTESGRSTH
jgi:dTDP-4-amino-4,6-dideoxygalactose transaminase